MSTSVETFLPINPACDLFVPDPPRVWTRYENRCIRCNVGEIRNTGYTPLLCTNNPSIADLNMRRKAEILQHKNNNANLSKKQKWAQMVKGNGPGKKYVWATQTVNYTNPNTKNLSLISPTALLCPHSPVMCALPSQCDVPGRGPPICMNKNIPLTRYIIQRTYQSGSSTWPVIKGNKG